MGLMKSSAVKKRTFPDEGNGPLFAVLMHKHPTASPSRMQSFERMINTDGLTDGCERIFNLIKQYGPITIQELERDHDVPINIGSGRTSDLLRMGYIERCGKKFNEQTCRNNSLLRAINNANFR
jgi:hypothetical protein